MFSRSNYWMLFKRLAKSLTKLYSKAREAHKSHARSPEWAKVRDTFAEKNPSCAACGGGTDIQVHHIRPFHLHPELELEPTNLISLCMGTDQCHLMIGHGDSFRCFNPNVIEDAARFAASSPEDRAKLVVEVRTRRQS